MRYTISFVTASVLACLVTPAAAEVPRVITDIPPVQALVAQVMGDLGAPVLLLDDVKVCQHRLDPQELVRLLRPR